MRTIKRKATSFDATALQISRAYRAYFLRDIAEETSFWAAAMQIVGEIGMDRADRFVRGQSNDVDASPISLHAIEHPES